MTTFRTEELNNTNLIEFEQLLKEVCAVERISLLRDKERLHYAMILKDEDKPVGILISWYNRFHPYADYIAIHVIPTYRNETVESILVQQAQLRLVVSHLQTITLETTYPLEDFYATYKFKEVRRTYTVTIDTDFIMQVMSLNDHFDLTAHNFNMVDLKQWSDIDIDYIKLGKCIKNSYEAVHTLNPPGTFDEVMWAKFASQSDVIVSGSFVILDASNQQIVAYSLMHTMDSSNMAELGWSYHVPELPKIFPFLIFKQIQYAHSIGISNLEIEIDDSDLARMELLKYFPTKPAPALVTYQWKPSP